MMLATYFDQYPAHLAAAVRKQVSSVVGRDHHHAHDDDSPCPIHGDEGVTTPIYLAYPLMASVPEEEHSESGKTYTVSSHSDNQEENRDSFEDQRVSDSPKRSSYVSPQSSPTYENYHRKSIDSYYTARESSPGFESHRKTSESYHTGRGSSPLSEIYKKTTSESYHHSGRGSSPLSEIHKKVSSVDSYVSARGKSSSGEFYFPSRKSSEERSIHSKSGDTATIYDREYKSYIPRDPECPIHSHCTKQRSSPVKSVPTTPIRSGPLTPPVRSARSNPSTPTREVPVRPTSLTRSSPIRVSLTRGSPVRSTSTSRLSGGGPYSISPPSLLLSSPIRIAAPPIVTMDAVESGSPGKGSPVIEGTPRRSAAESELLHCTICTKQFNNPKVLPCLHTFCHDCLLHTTPAESLTISCPECKQQSILPQAGVSDLQCNTWVQNVIDSLEYTSINHLNHCGDSGDRGDKSDDKSKIVVKNQNGEREIKTASVAPLKCDGGKCSDGCDEINRDPAVSSESSPAMIRCMKCRLNLCEHCQELHKIESEHEDYEPIPSLPFKNGDTDIPLRCTAGETECEDEVAPVLVNGVKVAPKNNMPEDDMFGDETKLYCPNHEGMTLRFYCRDCDTAICISCTDIQHRMHTTLRLSDAMQDQSNAMYAMVDAVANKVPALSCCIEDLDEAITELTQKRHKALDNIKETCEVLRHALDRREKELVETLHRKADDKQKMLETQKKELQTWRSNMSAGGELLQRSVQESKAPMELVLLKKQIGDKLKEYINADLPPGPRENTLLSFEKANVDSFLTSLKKVGYVVTNPAVPFTTIASGDSLRQVTVGKRGHVTVITRDFRGERVGVGGAQLTASITPKYAGTTPSPPTSPCSYESKESFPNVAHVSSSLNNSRAASDKSSSPQPHGPPHQSNGNSPSETNGGTPISTTKTQPTTERHTSFRRQSTSEESSVTGGGGHFAADLYSAKIVDHNTGIYDVEFIISRAGMYNLDLCLYGMPIDQSPFAVRAVLKKTSVNVQRGSTRSTAGSAHRSTGGSTCSVHGSEKSEAGCIPFGPFRQLSKQSVVSAKYSSVSSRTPGTSVSRRTPSQRSSSSRMTVPIEDDLLMKVGIRGRNKGEFVNPQGTCYSDLRGGRIVVTDSISQCVQVFSSEGEFKIRFGTRGRSVGQLQRPTGVGTLPNGNYAVADYENKCVSIFEPNGKFVNRIGHGKLLGPKGICADRQGNIIVVDNKGSCICIFTPNGKLLTKFGNRGMTYLSFAGPHFVAVDSQDHIIATDFHNHCVKVFDSSGEFLFTFGSHGEGNGQFNAPTGIAVDEHDNIIVADWGNCRIQVFDCRGSFLSFVNTLADPLHGPQGLTYSDDGHIVVADSGNHCYKVYKYLQ